MKKKIVDHKVAILSTTFSGNKGAASMLESIVNNVKRDCPDATFDLLTVYPGEDIKQNTYDYVKIVSNTPEQMIFFAFPLAILYWLFRWCSPIANLILKNKILASLKTSRVVVDATGVSFVDSRGMALSLYNFGCISVPLLLGCKTIKFSQAMGPFKKPVNRLLAKLTLRHLTKICARGSVTEGYLKELGLKNVALCADGALVMPDDEAAVAQVSEVFAADPFYAKKPVAFSISSVVYQYCLKHEIDYVGTMAKFIDSVILRGERVIILAQSARQNSEKLKNNDLPICRLVYEKVQQQSACKLLDFEMSAKEIREYIANSHLLVASRFHAMISALHKNVPVMLIGWSHKYKEVLDMYELGEYATDYKSLNFKKLVQVYEKFSNDEMLIREKIASHQAEVQKSSYQNIEIILQILEASRENAKKYMGDFQKCYIGYSAGKEVRENAASGGIVTTTLAYMLDRDMIDGAFVSKQEMVDGKVSARSFIATTVKEILDSATSIYVDFPLLKHLDLLLKFDGRLAVVALPCQIHAIARFVESHPELKEKIVLKISLFCSGSPSQEQIQNILVKNKIDSKEVRRVFFRKGHWRGMTSVDMLDGSTREFSYLYNICTYKNLYYDMLPRCLSCSNHFGYEADLSCGDVWLKEMKSNPIKHTGFIAKTPTAQLVVQAMIDEQVIVAKEISADQVLKSQKRALTFKFRTAVPRKKLGKHFGISYNGTVEDKHKWNHALAAFLILWNVRASRSPFWSKVVYAMPRRLLFLYMGFIRVLLNK